MLKPLEQFYCDKCGEIIKSKEEGWFEWISEKINGVWRTHSFKIVHHYSVKKGCYFHENADGRHDNHLHYINYPYLLSFLDNPFHDPENVGYRRPTDMREFTEILRRMILKYYEEARQYWNNAIKDGFFDGANETWPYEEDTLKKIIEKYEENEY